MPLTTTQAKRFFYRGVRFALVICILVFIFHEPLKPIILPRLKFFVNTHTEALLNFIFYVFLVCSTTLIMLVYWAISETRKMRRKPNYFSQVMAKDYYKSDKKLDYEHFMAGNMLRQQTQALETDSEVGAQKETKVKPEEGNPLDDLGTSDGVHRTFFKNGQLKSETSYKDGKLHGIFHLYYEDGMIHQEKHYRNGKLNGVFKAYDENGVAYFEIHYKDDKQDGADKTFYKSGATQYEDIYDKGIHVKRKTFDEDGSLVFEQDITPDNAPGSWR